MERLNKVALVVSKILEVFHWIGEAGMLAVLVCSLVAGDWLENILTDGVSENGTMLSTYGFELMAVNADGTVNMKAVMLFSIGAIMILGLMAMVFRNIYLIIKTAKGGTWFANGSTPFQKDIVRMVREIGIFYIAVPVVGLAMSVISRLMLGAETAEISMSLEGFVTGLIILCLSQIFSYGMQLQRDVDGLL